MGKRHMNDTHEWEPSRKKQMHDNGITPGDVLQDIAGKQWKLGTVVGNGAFGEIYMASDDTTKDVDKGSQYVAKLELHSNGPLFVEVNFYLRVAREELINEWKLKNRKVIGLPHYIASGSYKTISTKYRFLILPRYSIDLEQVHERLGNNFNIKTVITIGLQLLDTLEYIHSHGFIHADIKASNILLNEEKVMPLPVPVNSESMLDVNSKIDKKKRIKNELRNARLTRRSLRSDKNLPPANPPEHAQAAQVDKQPAKDINQVYLLDFGLAGKYVQSNGQHKHYCVDERKAHAGTILFCSLDAHHGVQSRRSDLESMGYNMVYWLTGSLPWGNNMENYETVKKKKQICMQEIDNFLHYCFGRNIPTFLRNYFNHVKSLEYEQSPDYEYCRKILRAGFNEYSYKKVFTFDFNNKEGWGLKKKRAKNSENCRRQAKVVCSIMRTPLKSNLPAKHALRKNNLKNRMLRWSKILIDPELIIKSAKKSKEKVHDYNEGGIEGMANLNIYDLNPTEAMMDVYNKYFNRKKYDMLPRHRGDCDCPNIDGYNAAMMAIYNKMIDERERERELAQMVNKSPKRKYKKNPLRKRKATTSQAKKVNNVKEPPLKKYNTRNIKKPNYREY